MNSLVNFSRGRVDDPLARELGDDLVADGVHQVGLAEAHPAVQEERVVGVPGPLGDRQAGGVGEAVGRADDEVREGVAGVEVRSRRPRRRPGSAPGAPAGAAPDRPPAMRRSPLRPHRLPVGARARRRSRPGRCSRRSGRASGRSASGSGSRASPWRSRSAPRSGSGCRRRRPAAVSRSHVSKFAGERATWSSPRAARQTCFASIDGSDLWLRGGRWVAGGRARARGNRGVGSFGALCRPAAVRSRGSSGGSSRGLPPRFPAPGAREG